jgi:phosphopantothenoylcysteine decarboxylase/phosphopantothenate--cysteine ligase
VNLFERESEWEVEHIGLARWADLFLVCPATANIVAKMAQGIADDSVSTTYLSFDGPVYVAPAMNTVMYDNPAFQRNLKDLIDRGVHVIEPGEGSLACGEEGRGRLAEPASIVDTMATHFSQQGTLNGKNIVVTAGPTREYIDDVRYISNPSSGKMGIAIAEEAARRGANVTLILGPSTVPVCTGPSLSVKRVTTADEMAAETSRYIKDANIAVFAAAVSDYKPSQRVKGKVKKSTEEMVINLDRTPDVALDSSQGKKKGQIFVGFAAEAGDNIHEAQRKMEAKKFDYLLLNDITRPDSGFMSDSNEVILLTPGREPERWEKMPKKKIAALLFDRISFSSGI